jgi:hypothetical protein
MTPVHSERVEVARRVRDITSILVSTALCAADERRAIE